MSVLLFHNYETIADEGAEDLRLTRTAKAPAGAVKARVQIQMHTNTPNDVLTFQVDSVLFEKATTASDYFDGSVKGWQWSGTPHASTSIPGALGIYDLSLLATAPSDAAFGMARVETVSFTTPLDVFEGYYDSIAVTKSPVSLGYFDGNSPNSEWLGTVNNSQSIRMGDPENPNNTTATVINKGNFNAQPIITIAERIVAPVITNETTGEAIKLSGTVANGQSVFIDVAKRKMTDNLGNNAFNLLAPDSGWFELVPGTNLISVTSTDYDSDVAVTISYRHSVL